MLSIRSQIAAYLIVLAAGPAVADVCVTCSGPTATYACSVKKAEEIEAFAGAKAIVKICTKVLKSKGQHSGCQVVESAACPGGAPTTIGWREVKDALASKDDTDPAPTKAPAVPPKAVEAKPVPKENAAEAKPAPQLPPEEPAPANASLGDNIKGAAEKTWKCVSSFFGQC